MKKILLMICAIFMFNAAFASTDASKFAEKTYAAQTGSEQVHIVVKKEHTMEYQQPVGDEMIPALTYGYGDMKVKGCKKCRIVYICLLDKNLNPLWSYIIPSK